MKTPDDSKGFRVSALPSQGGAIIAGPWSIANASTDPFGVQWVNCRLTVIPRARGIVIPKLANAWRAGSVGRDPTQAIP
jgi:hypothetical protein